MIIKDPQELKKISENYRHAGMFCRGEIIIPLNTTIIPIDDRINEIIKRLQADTLPAGTYEIHFKSVNRKDIKPDIVTYSKETGLSECSPKIPEDLSEKQKAEIELYKVQLLNERLNKELEELRTINKELDGELRALQTELEELQENDEIRANEATQQKGLLSEQTIKAAEPIIQTLAGLIQPLAESWKAKNDLELRMKQMAFVKELERRYPRNPSPGGNGGTMHRQPMGEPDDEFIVMLKNIRKENPEHYNLILRMFAEQQQQGPTETIEEDEGPIDEDNEA